MASKKDNKGQNFTYQYDTYNRLKSIMVNGTLLRTFIYDTNTLDSTGFSQNTWGRLAAVQYPANAQGIQFNDMYSYIGAGSSGAGLPSKKRLQVNQATGGGTQTQNLDASHTYNSEGAIASTTYPTTYTYVGPPGQWTSTPGPVYTYSFDNMYRPSSLTDANNNSIVSGVSYGPSNEMLGMTYNQAAESRTYNTLLQLTSITTTSLGTTQVKMQYNYPAAPGNNGKACLATDLVAGEQVAYTYDSLNRLSAASAYTTSGSSTNCSSTLYVHPKRSGCRANWDLFFWRVLRDGNSRPRVPVWRFN